MAALGLTPDEGHLLSYLLPYGPCPVTELVRVFGIKPSTLTSQLDRVERRGLITRAVNPNDRRSLLVALAPDGRDLARRVNRPVADLEEAIAGEVSARDLVGFRRVMEAIDRVTDVEVRPRARSKPSPIERTQKRSKKRSTR